MLANMVSASAQIPRWTGEIAFNYLTELQALPLLHSVQLIVETESDSALAFHPEISSASQACISFCHHQKWPPPLSAERCAQWLHRWTQKPESLALLGKIADYYGEYYPQAAIASLGGPRNTWILAFLASGLKENFGDMQPEGPAGLWGLHPQRARVYGLRVEEDYDERFLPERATQILLFLARDVGTRPDLLVTALLLGPAAASSLQDSITDSVRRFQIGEAYDVYVALLVAMEKVSETLTVSLNPALKRPWFSKNYSEGPLCLESISRHLGLSPEAVYYHNAHWRVGCLQPAVYKVLRLPPDKSDELVQNLNLIKAHSDSLRRLCDTLSGHTEPLLWKSYVKTTEVRRYHTVRKGETLSTIARRYGLSREDLRRLNRLRSDKIAVGQKLLVRTTRTSEVVRPSSDLQVRLKGYTESSASKDGPGTARRDSTGTQLKAHTARWHTVRAGDTLGSIARRYGVSLNSLKKANGLSTDVIRVGQRLRIP